MTEKKLIVLVGPTAVGKTDLCIRLAQKYNAPILSADSRQFYQEMSIGTAKPTTEELSLAKHYFINSRSIHDEYSVAQFEREAIAVLKDHYQESDIAILSGGSGLFIDAVLNGLDEIPEIDSTIRNDVNTDLEEKGLDFLLQELKEIDPDYYNSVDKQNPRRVIRGIEVYRQTQTPFSEYRKASKKKRFFDCIKIGLQRDREELYNRINLRVDAMMEAGLLEEVKELFIYKNNSSMQTVGYTELIGFLEDKYTFAEAVELIKRNTRRYAKRQMTWFRKDNEINWVHPDDYDTIVEIVNSSKV